MALSKNDLKAIQQVVRTTVKPMIDDLAEDTAAGFAEVHGKFAEVHGRIDQLDDKLTKKIDGVDAKLEVNLNKLENTLQRVDAHGIEISNIRWRPSAA